MDKILMASYGDRQQHQANQKPVDPNNAARIQAEWKARKAAEGPRELPPGHHGSNPSASPLFWDPKLHGQALGGHNAVRNPNPKPVKVEIRPGVFHTVQVVAAGAGAGARAGAGGGVGARPVSAPVNRPAVPQGRSPGVAARLPSAGAKRSSPGPGQTAAPSGSPGPSTRPQLPCELDTVQLAPIMEALEQSMRKALSHNAKMHVVERTVLLRAIGKVVGKRDVDLGVQDTLDTSQFGLVWASLGVTIAPPYVNAIFNKYGHTSQGRMPVMVFVESLMYGAPRQLMLENDWVQRGAFVRGQPATHMGKIQYPECKKGVWPPSNWDPQLGERSSQLPNARLQLEFVHGYDGFQATSPNIFYTATGEVVYFAAAVGIVYNKVTHTQRFFLGHDDDILCMAIHPDRNTVATGQVGKDPCVIIWDTTTCKPIQRINQGYGNRGVQAACFSSSGTKLAVVCLDNSHTMYIWDWPRKQLLLERKTMPGTPPSTYGIVWSPFQHDRLVAYGQNFIKFMEVARPKGPGVQTWECKQSSGVFSIAKTYTVFSACFLPSGVVLTGNGQGVIGSWKGARLVRETAAHATGPMERRPDGVKSYGGIRSLLLQSNSVLLSGGADGYVIKWDVSSGDVGAALQRIPMLRPDQIGSMQPPSIRGLDCFPGSDIFIAGTASCNVWEVDATPEILIYGQEGNLCGLAMNSTYPNIFATACDSETVMVWSATSRKPIRVVQIATKGDKARSCAFSPNGEHLAIGMTSGGLKVMEFHPSTSQVFWGKTFSDAITELKYSPCGRYLAAGSHDQNIDIFDVKAGYKHTARCVGHSSTITHIDWAADSSHIQSNDRAYEVLYFDARTGKQVKENQRDTLWQTWTCTLGFNVMGIWQPHSDGTDVNSCDRSPTGRYLLTADDFGKVSLFNYPVVVRHAPALRYGGHSAFVTNVRWATDESYAVSVGGRDRCVLQWRLVPETKAQDHFYGKQPLQPLDKQGLVYRMTDG